MITEQNFFDAKILVVDDDPMSIKIISDILKKTGYTNITSTTDSREAKALYEELRPDLLILDLNMPYFSGFDVMGQLKHIEKEEGFLPILILSNEEDKEKRFLALESGAKDFINKPYDRSEVLLRIHNLIEVRLLQTEIRDHNKLLTQRVKERTQDLYDAQLFLIERLARAIEYRDSETGFHILRMSHYSACLAAQVGFNEPQCEVILRASPLHDIGKIGIPDSILQKPGKLTPEEWTIMKTHTTIGGDLLSGSNFEILEMGRQIAIAHHEKWDGSGYPYGLKGEEIPLIGRICGLADVFDALTTVRPYKKAWRVEDALAEISKGSGSHFDPDLAKIFIDVTPQIIEIKENYADVNHNTPS